MCLNDDGKIDEVEKTYQEKAVSRLACLALILVMRVLIVALVSDTKVIVFSDFIGYSPAPTKA